MGRGTRNVELPLPLLALVAVAGASVTSDVRAQSAPYNHLDCWYHADSQSIQCPPFPAVQTGRAAAGETSTVEAPERSMPLAVKARAKNPSCRRYRTYDPSTHSYRGYDGVIRKCQ